MDPFTYYNKNVKLKTFLNGCLLLALITGFVFTSNSLQINRAAAAPAQAGGVTAYDLIIAMNSVRASNGLPALIEDPIIDAVAQSTAQIMAANQMSWHIGNVSGRLAAAGYGGGATVWATENFAVGYQSIDEIMVVWSDAAHMLPATTAAYCNIGAGIATAGNGMTYYILQAAYIAGKSCGDYASSPTTPRPGETPISIVPQIIMPVKIATPDADGKVFHVVQAGQSFWSIAIAYKITIKELKTWNNLSDASTLKVGEKLFIPGSNTAGFATPTQPGAVQVATPDNTGRVIHVVQAYQSLSIIARAYGTTVDGILALNNLQVDWPLRIGQELLIQPSNLTPSPTLHPLQLLTPASDGKYYHTVKSGETLSWIAAHYGVSVSELMAWNGLSASSIIRPDQKLLLQVTPPATVTPTPAPPTITPTATYTPPPVTPPPVTPSLTAASPTPVPAGPLPGRNLPASLMVAIILLVAASGLGIYLYRMKK